MKEYAVWYRPIWGTFTRYVEYVEGCNQEHAMSRFYARCGDNCDAILLVERVA